jgi:3-oxoacyl-(acyl-carrier-protein) synthase III
VTGGRFTAFTGMGSALPERVVPNSFFERTLDTSDAWIRDRTGIGARHFVAEGENTSDLVVQAARKALDSARMTPEQVDVLVVGTFTADRPMPSAAVIAQAKLGMSCPAFDVNAACAGFSYGVTVGAGLIASGTAERVLVVGADVLSRKLNLADRSTCVLFGDGAGAAVLSVADEPGIMASSLAADGTQAHVLTIPAGGVERPITPEAVERGEDKLTMTSGREVFRRAVLAMTSACRSLLDKAGVRPEDLALVIPHQANARIISAVAERLGVGADRAVLDIEEVGNTSAASIPLALDRAWRAGRVHPGDLVLMVSFGAGLAWGAHLVRWTAGPAEAA